ncbi:MAG TPA: hypothetical protein VNA27_07095 [Rubrobacteraceae bacterium]|nr:hypothetical protein [Rubrobacteraceae bacterium]
MDASSFAMHVLERSATLWGGCLSGRVSFGVSRPFYKYDGDHEASQDYRLL